MVVIECILNQNARDSGAARFPAMNLEFVQLCHANNIGILQMPCPEIAALGFKRIRRSGQSIREALATIDGRQRCIELATEVTDRIEAYLAEGQVLLAILGGNPQSPGCAVQDGEGRSSAASGIFMQELQSEMRKRNLDAVFKGLRDHDPQLLQQDLQWFRGLLNTAPDERNNSPVRTSGDSCSNQT